MADLPDSSGVPGLQGVIQMLAQGGLPAVGPMPPQRPDDLGGVSTPNQDMQQSAPDRPAPQILARLKRPGQQGGGAATGMGAMNAIKMAQGKSKIGAIAAGLAAGMQAQEAAKAQQNKAAMDRIRLLMMLGRQNTMLDQGQQRIDLQDMGLQQRGDLGQQRIDLQGMGLQQRGDQFQQQFGRNVRQDQAANEARNRALAIQEYKAQNPYRPTRIRTPGEMRKLRLQNRAAAIKEFSMMNFGRDKDLSRREAAQVKDYMTQWDKDNPADDPRILAPQGAPNNRGQMNATPPTIDAPQQSTPMASEPNAVDDFSNDQGMTFPRVTTRDEALKLDPGAKFIGPDGATYIR